MSSKKKRKKVERWDRYCDRWSIIIIVIVPVIVTVVMVTVVMVIVVIVTVVMATVIAVRMTDGRERKSSKCVYMYIQIA